MRRVSRLVRHRTKVGEIWDTDISPYQKHRNRKAAYVVFRDGSADWIRMQDLKLVEGAATNSATA
jgi:hypothetical protein